MMWPPKGRKRRILAIHTHKTRLRMFRMRQSVYTLPASNIKQATEKMWNNPKPFSLFLIVSFLIASMCSCNADDTGGKDVTPPDTTNMVPTAKTVLIYMAAQNSLGARRNQHRLTLWKSCRPIKTYRETHAYCFSLTTNMRQESIGLTRQRLGPSW